MSLRGMQRQWADEEEGSEIRTGALIEGKGGRWMSGIKQGTRHSCQNLCRCLDSPSGSAHSHFPVVVYCVRGAL